MRWFCFFSAISLFSCASFSYRSPGAYYGGSLVGAGTYFAEVAANPRKSENFRFTFQFQRKPGGALISALAPSGQAVFRVADSLDSAAEPAIKWINPQEQRKEHFANLYRCLRVILLLRDKPAVDSSLVLERYEDRRPKRLHAGAGVESEIQEYDWEGHAFRVRCLAPELEGELTLREYRVETVTSD